MNILAMIVNKIQRQLKYRGIIVKRNSGDLYIYDDDNTSVLFTVEFHYYADNIFVMANIGHSYQNHCTKDITISLSNPDIVTKIKEFVIDTNAIYTKILDLSRKIHSHIKQIEPNALNYGYFLIINRNRPSDARIDITFDKVLYTTKKYYEPIFFSIDDPNLLDELTYILLRGHQSNLV